MRDLTDNFNVQGQLVLGVSSNCTQWVVVVVKAPKSSTPPKGYLDQARCRPGKSPIELSPVVLLTLGLADDPNVIACAGSPVEHSAMEFRGPIFHSASAHLPRAYCPINRLRSVQHQIPPARSKSSSNTQDRKDRHSP